MSRSATPKPQQLEDADAASRKTAAIIILCRSPVRLKRIANTSKKTKIQAMAAKSRPVKPCNNLAPITRRSITTVNMVTRPLRTVQKVKAKALVAGVSSDSVF